MDFPQSSPGLSPEEAAIGLAGLTAPTMAAEAPRAPVRWLTDVKRVESYTLLYPFAIGDIEYRTITVKRLNAGEVAAFVAKLSALPEESPPARYPMFFVGEAEISDEAWNGMDDDDRVALIGIMEGFLSARFRR